MKKFYPTQLMLQDAAKGLRLYKEGYGGKGLVKETIDWIRAGLRGAPLPYAKVVKMRAWFRRHQVDYRPGWSKNYTPGYVANLLWFGWDGWRWAEIIVAKEKGEPKPLARLAHIREMKKLR
jgi:hypothetical protein